jgi:uncharacterized membrane protein
LYSLGHQIIYAALAITASAFGVIFDGRGQARQAHVAWCSAIGLAVILGLSILTTRARMRRARSRR